LLPASYWFLACYTLQILTMQATCSSETLIDFQRTTCQYIFIITTAKISNLTLHTMAMLFSRAIKIEIPHLLQNNQQIHSWFH
jgi:hypothetical protein